MLDTDIALFLSSKLVALAVFNDMLAVTLKPFYNRGQELFTGIYVHLSLFISTKRSEIIWIIETFFMVCKIDTFAYSSTSVNCQTHFNSSCH